MPLPILKQNLAITTTPHHTLHLRAVPTPTPAPNECLIHVRATGICGSDVHFWKEGGIGDSKVEGELGLGHESSGVVVGLGEGVEGWQVGEFVLLDSLVLPFFPPRGLFSCLFSVLIVFVGGESVDDAGRERLGYPSPAIWYCVACWPGKTESRSIFVTTSLNCFSLLLFGQPLLISYFTFLSNA